jgi:uncharacterized membrane protein (GlpM family)
MSFGLTNVPAYFMYLMNKVFMEYLDKLLLMGMCATSVECITVQTAVLIVKSCMDPHMISRDSS